MAISDHDIGLIRSKLSRSGRRCLWINTEELKSIPYDHATYEQQVDIEKVHEALKRVCTILNVREEMRPADYWDSVQRQFTAAGVAIALAWDLHHEYDGNLPFGLEQFGGDVLVIRYGPIAGAGIGPGGIGVAPLLVRRKNGTG